jgi:hypothetical protein
MGERTFSRVPHLIGCRKLGRVKGPIPQKTFRKTGNEAILGHLSADPLKGSNLITPSGTHSFDLGEFYENP